MGFPSGYPGVPIGILVDSHEVSMEPLWHFYGIPLGFFVFYWIFMSFSWISLPFLEDFYWILVGFPCYVYDISKKKSENIKFKLKSNLALKSEKSGKIRKNQNKPGKKIRKNQGKKKQKKSEKLRKQDNPWIIYG